MYYLPLIFCYFLRFCVIRKLIFVVSVMENIIAFYPRDAMLARVFAIATCPSVCLSVCPPHAGIVPSRAKEGS